jgi:hypothetical protein
MMEITAKELLIVFLVIYVLCELIRLHMDLRYYKKHNFKNIKVTGKPIVTIKNGMIKRIDGCNHGHEYLTQIDENKKNVNDWFDIGKN